MIRTAIWLAIDTAQALLEIAKIAAADPGRPKKPETDRSSQPHVHYHVEYIEEALRREQSRRHSMGAILTRDRQAHAAKLLAR